MVYSCFSATIVMMYGTLVRQLVLSTAIIEAGDPKLNQLRRLNTFVFVVTMQFVSNLLLAILALNARIVILAKTSIALLAIVK